MRNLNIECIENDLGRSFWTRMDEMLDDIEEAGYPVDYMTEEYVIIRESEDEDAQEFILYIGHANTTMWIESIRKGN